MTSWLGALVAVENVLLSMEKRDPPILKFPLCTCHTVYSTLANRPYKQNRPRCWQCLFEDSSSNSFRVTQRCVRESARMSDSPREVVLSPEDIPGASLSKPYEKYTVAALRWWLLCRGVKAPTSTGDYQQVSCFNVLDTSARHINDCA